MLPCRLSSFHFHQRSLQNTIQQPQISQSTPYAQGIIHSRSIPPVAILLSIPHPPSFSPITAPTQPQKSIVQYSPRTGKPLPLQTHAFSFLKIVFFFFFFFFPFHLQSSFLLIFLSFLSSSLFAFAFTFACPSQPSFFNPPDQTFSFPFPILSSSLSFPFLLSSHLPLSPPLPHNYFPKATSSARYLSFVGMYIECGYINTCLDCMACLLKQGKEGRGNLLVGWLVGGLIRKKRTYGGVRRG